MPPTIDDVYEWPIKSAWKQYERYHALWLSAPYGSRRERAYLGLKRKWAAQWDALVVQYEAAIAKEQQNEPSV